jgi:flagellar motor protein MotB
VKQLNATLSSKRPIRRRGDDNSTSMNELLSMADSEGTWAVAYADLLMVLMSFFVIFSSFGTESSQNELYKIAVNLSQISSGAGTGTRAGVGSGAGTGTGGVAKEEEKPLQLVLPEDVFSELSRQKLHYINEGKSVLVSFDGDQFAPGSFEIRADLKNQLSHIADVLAPYKEHIQILVVGHADSQVVKNHINPYMKDNFDVSSLRALAATRYLSQQGISPSHLLSQASSDNEISKRSLSLRISSYREHSQ